MKCVKCNRRIKKPSATVTTPEGSMTYGPVCAMALGLFTAALRKSRAVRRARKVRAVPIVFLDDRQMELAV
jgi:hypothetical protein